MCKKTTWLVISLFMILSFALAACQPAAAPTQPPAPTTAPASLAVTPASLAVTPTTPAAAPTIPAVVPTSPAVAPTSPSAAKSGSIQWPSKMPADVPLFTYGTITSSSNDIMGNIQASYNNVTADAFSKYQSDLKNAGWTISNANQSASGFEIDAAKAPRGVVAMFITSKTTGLTGAVTYNDHGG